MRLAKRPAVVVGLLLVVLTASDGTSQERVSPVAVYDSIKKSVVLHPRVQQASKLFGAAALLYAFYQTKVMEEKGEYTLEDQFQALDAQMRFWREAKATPADDFEQIVAFTWAGWNRGPEQFFRELWLRTAVFLQTSGAQAGRFQPLRNPNVDYTFEYPAGWREETLREHPRSVFVRGPLNLDRTLHAG